MTLDEINDDLGLSKPPYKVVAAIAVYGRLPLLEHTIKRLYQKNGCYKVICSGDQPEDRKLCESLGAVWVTHNNRHLGGKWNLAFTKAKEYNPDAVLFVGSSDWVCDDWIKIIRPYVDQYGFVGVPGCYMADLGEKIRLLNWEGYKTCRPERSDETIGIGRMLSRRLLDAIGWQPFKPILNNSLDRSMKDNAKRCKFTDFMVHDERLKAISISTHLWPNKHKFEQHWDETHPKYAPSIKMNPEPFISTHFPEANKLFQSLPKPIYEEPSPGVGGQSAIAPPTDRVPNLSL
jgi:hypothetical protein